LLLLVDPLFSVHLEVERHLEDILHVNLLLSEDIGQSLETVGDDGKPLGHHKEAILAVSQVLVLVFCHVHEVLWVVADQLGVHLWVGLLKFPQTTTLGTQDIDNRGIEKDPFGV